MSVDVIKKTDEIEKLAKSVREKIETAYDVPAGGAYAGAVGGPALAQEV